MCICVKALEFLGHIDLSRIIICLSSFNQSISLQWFMQIIVEYTAKTVQ